MHLDIPCTGVDCYLWHTRRHPMIVYGDVQRYLLPSYTSICIARSGRVVNVTSIIDDDHVLLAALSRVRLTAIALALSLQTYAVAPLLLCTGLLTLRERTIILEAVSNILLCGRSHIYLVVPEQDLETQSALVCKTIRATSIVADESDELLFCKTVVNVAKGKGGGSWSQGWRSRECAGSPKRQGELHFTIP